MSSFKSDQLSIGVELGTRGHPQYGALRTEQSPLHLAVLNGSIGIVQILIDAGADVNARCSGDPSNLATALDQRRMSILDARDRGGLDLSGLCQEGRTPLEIAIVLRDEDMVRLLVSYGANVNLQPASPSYASASHLGGTYIGSEQYAM